MTFIDSEVVHTVEGEQCEHIFLHTTHGDIAAFLYGTKESLIGETAVLWAGSLRGEDRAYRSNIIACMVAKNLAEGSIASLLLKYRVNSELWPCVRDTQAGIEFLESLGVRRIALVGHSFSGAVVISAAPLSRAVVAVVTLASQTFGANNVARISPRPLLLVHGTKDQRLKPYCSEQIYSWARIPKELVFLDGASHSLLECKDTLLPLLNGWLTEQLGDNVYNVENSDRYTG